MVYIEIKNKDINNLKYRFENFDNNDNKDDKIFNNSNIQIKKIYDKKKFDKILFFNKITNKLVKKNICPNFIMMFSYDKSELNISMECVVGTFEYFIKNNYDEKIFISGLFQIIYSIMILQKIIKTLHTNLVIKNIFYKKINSRIKYFKYIIDNTEYFVPTYGYLFMIGNFDKAQTLIDKKKIFSSNLNKEDVEFGINYNLDFDGLKSIVNKILETNKKFNYMKLIMESKNDIREILKDYFFKLFNLSNIENSDIKVFNYNNHDKNKNKNKNKNQLSRYISNYGLIDNIKKLYEINKFNYSTSKYFHLLPDRNFTPKFISPMYDDIKPYDFIKPIEKLNSRFRNDYYLRLIKNYNYDKKSRLDLYNLTKLLIADLDEIMIQYIKCRPKCFVITLWPIFVEYLDLMVKYLETKGNIYYIKYIDFEPNGLINYLTSIYDEFSNKDILRIAKNKYSWSRLDGQKFDKIGIIIFDNINDLGLSGQASKFKTELRNWAMNVLKNNNVNIEDKRGNDLIHINDYFYQTIEYCELLLNSNSINLLNNRLYSKIYDDYFRTTHLKIETYRKIMYSNLSLETINSLFLIAGVSLFFYGFRPISDLDGICVNMDQEYKNKTDKSSEEIKTITRLFCDEKTRIFYIEFGTTNTEYWKEKWTQFNNLIAKYFGITNFNDICWNPNYHYYFKGIKCYLIDFEFYKKLQRSNEIIGTNIWPTLSKDYTDYIMINLLNPKIIEKYIYINKSDGKLTVSNSIINIYPKLKNPLPFNTNVLELIKKFLQTKYKVYLKQDINNDFIISLF
jgi:hypothetical protein